MVITNLFLYKMVKPFIVRIRNSGTITSTNLCYLWVEKERNSNIVNVRNNNYQKLLDYRI